MTMGCLKVEKKSDVAKPAPASPAQTQPMKKEIARELRLDDVYMEFVGQSQPDVYNLIFSWPETRDRVRVSVDGQMMFAVKTYERSEEAIPNLQGGRKIKVLIEILDDKYHVITSKIDELEVPKDYVFPKNFKLPGNMNILNERVFMNNSVITTESFNLTIKTKKLIILDSNSNAEHSRIQNFPADSKAKHGNDGRSGGFINIQADTAEGDLTFLMNSEAGGDALKGFYHTFGDLTGGYVAPSAICVFGTNGYSAGKNGDLYLNVKDISKFKQYVQVLLSEGGKLAPVLTTPDKDPEYPSATLDKIYGTNCTNNPIVGAEAQPGKVCLTFSGQTPQSECE